MAICMVVPPGMANVVAMRSEVREASGGTEASAGVGPAEVLAVAVGRGAQAAAERPVQGLGPAQADRPATAATVRSVLSSRRRAASTRSAST